MNPGHRGNSKSIDPLDVSDAVIILTVTYFETFIFYKMLALYINASSLFKTGDGHLVLFV